MSNKLPIKSALLGTELDARMSGLTGSELAKQINSTVEATQKTSIIGVLPDRLLVTQKQFAELNNYTEKMYQTSDRMYRTNYNVMEVIIDRQKDTVTEINDILEGVDELTKLEKEQDNEQTN